MANFWSKVQVTDSCWLWTGSVDKCGYGVCWLKVNGVQMQRSHRTAWALMFGSIPQGLNVLHKCDVPNCVNPAHLFLGTQRDNVHDAMDKGRMNHVSGMSHFHGKKTHCAKGHAFTPENVRITGKNQRWCRECGRIANRACYWRKKGKENGHS